MKKKSQAALEFLTTYAWAFLTIILTTSALYYFGVFDFAKYLPQKCNFPQQFRCIDSTIKDTDIKFRLLNDIGEKVTVVSLSVTDDASDPLTCDTMPLSFDWEDDEEKDVVLSDCHGGTFIKGDRLEAKISFTYYAVDTPAKPEHTIRGKIISIIQ